MSTDGNSCVGTRASRAWTLAAVAWLALVAGVIALTVGDYGMSWDEPFRWAGGDTKLEYYRALLDGQQPEIPGDAYPGLFDLTLALIRDWSGADPMVAGHWLSAAFGWLGLVAVWRIGALVGGARAGFWAVILLTLMPRYYGHMFFNPKDIPFAACFAWGLWGVLRINWSDGLHRSRCTTAGGVIGLTMSTRLGGLLLLAYSGLLAGVDFCRGLVADPVNRSNWFRGAVARLITLAVVTIVAFLVLILWWPATHAGLFGATRDTVGVITSYPWNAPVMFDGAFYLASELPFFYLPWYVIVTIPEVAFLLAAAALVFGVLRIRGVVRKRAWTVREQQAAILALAFFFPIGYVMVRDVTVYDGMRHFLFILPPLACLLALALEQILRQVERKIRPLALALQLGIALLLVPVAWSMVALHPYQYTYFNQVVGGIAGADGRYETDYWGTSYREAVEGLASVVDADTQWTLHCFGAKWLAEPFLPENIRYVDNIADADFYLSITRLNMHRMVDAPVIVQVERNGVPLALIKDLRR